MSRDRGKGIVPRISVIIPARNEEKRIAEAIESLLAQDTKDSFEIIVIEGKSSDSTKRVVLRYQQKHRNIVLLRNPSGNTAVGRNIGVQAARGEYVMNFSAHAVARKDMLRVLAAKLDVNKGIAAAGCANVSPRDSSFVARCVSVIYASLFGGVRSVDQNARFTKDQFVQSVAFSLYRKSILTRVGLFDPKFWCGQDFEVNYRIVSAGYKIVFTPDTVVYRYNRDSVWRFAQQMFRYGIARNFIVRKHPSSLRLPYVIPSMLLMYAMIGVALIGMGIVGGGIAKAFALSWAVYACIGWISSALVSRDVKVIAASPFFYLVEHLLYGAGFIGGFLYQKF